MPRCLEVAVGCLGGAAVALLLVTALLSAVLWELWRVLREMH